MRYTYCQTGMRPTAAGSKRYLSLMLVSLWLGVMTPGHCIQVEPLQQPNLFTPHPQRQALLREHFQLGVQRAREGLLQEAIGHFKYCIGLDAAFVDAYYLLGLVYSHLGLSYLRETDYAMGKVLELQPSNLDALVYRGLTRMRLGDFVAAKKDFLTILTYAPETVPVRRDLAGAYLRQGKFSDAIAAYKAVIDEVPDDLLARWNLCVAYAQQGGYPADRPERYRITLTTQGSGPSPVTYTDVTQAAGIDAPYDRFVGFFFDYDNEGHGATFADFDNDGDLDIYAPIGGAMSGDRQPGSLYRHNGTSKHWLKLRLIGTISNPEAIGARLTATLGPRRLYRTVAGGAGFGSMNDPTVFLGLGDATRVEHLHIRWPSGIEQVVQDIPARQLLVITEGQPTVRQTGP